MSKFIRVLRINVFTESDRTFDWENLHARIIAVA